MKYLAVWQARTYLIHRMQFEQCEWVSIYTQSYSSFFPVYEQIISWLQMANADIIAPLEWLSCNKYEIYIYIYE